MFTIINIKNRSENEKNSISQKLKYYYYKNKIFIEKYDEFYILNYNNYGKKIKWKKIIKKCPTDDVLLTKNQPKPKDFRLRTYNSIGYRQYLLKHTIEKILTEINIPSSHKSLLIIDKNANYCDLVSDIAKSCAGLYVMTNNTSKYTQVQRTLIKELGLSLSICTKIPNKNNVILCIAFSDISCYNISLIDIPTFVMTEDNNIFKKSQFPINIIMHRPKSFCYDEILPQYKEKVNLCGAVREFNNKICDDYCEEFILRDNIISFQKLLVLLENNT